MSTRARTRTTMAAVAASAALLIPASQAGAGAQMASGGDGPVATKSGAIVNYTSTKKLKVAKQMFIHFTCAVTCDATGTAKLKGPRVKVPAITASATLPANVPSFMQLTIKGALLKLLKDRPGAFKVNNTITATDPTTGATDTITHTFKFKR